MRSSCGALSEWVFSKLVISKVSQSQVQSSLSGGEILRLPVVFCMLITEDDVKIKAQISSFLSIMEDSGVCLTVVHHIK